MSLAVFEKNIILNATLVCVLWCLFCVSSSVQFDHSALFIVSCIALFGLTLIRPIWGIGIFLIIMPFFGGSKPQDEHTVRFYTLLSTTVFASTLFLAYGLMRQGKKLKCDFSHPLVFALLVYWLMAAISLVTVAPNEVVYSVFRFQSPLTRQFFNLSEGSYIYPYLAFFALTISLLLGILIINIVSTSEKVIFLMRCFLMGLLLTVFLGLFDYYDLINLNAIRPWYFLPAFGESYRFERLTSVFGNPGWYAQYLVLGSPALLSILALRWQKKWKIALLVSLIIVTEFCIILIYQRGGWLSYPLTLLIIWFCVYVLDNESKNFSRHIQDIKRSLLKIAITLPLTIAISLSLVYFTARVQPENRQQISDFAQRAESIANVNDRLRYWEPAFLMARLHPLFGPGLESFASQYEKLYIAPGHLYFQSPEYDIGGAFGSAHNLYFQALAGKGYLGLLSLFGVMLAAISLVWRSIFTVSASGLSLSQPQRLLLMMTLAYTCALAIYGNVGEIFYSPIGYILFILFFAGSIGSVPPSYVLSRRFRIWVLSFLACAFLVHLYLEFGARFGI
jgi:O-antigen ligase